MTQTESGSAEQPTALIVGTRCSDLALWQTRFVAREIQSRFPGISLVERQVQTLGDLELEKPLPMFGGKGLFTEELDRQLLNGDIDCAVHSMKDLPTELLPGQMLGAVFNREDPRDVWVCPAGHTLAEIPPGLRVGTSSLRRQAQLLAMRPDLIVRSIRGNVPTRIQKAQQGEFDAIVIAAAGVKRLERTICVTQWLSMEQMLPAPGQGALAVTCRAEDRAIQEILRAIHEPAVAKCTESERQLLTALGGGCSAPIAAYAEIVSANNLEKTGLDQDSCGHWNLDSDSFPAIRLVARVVSPNGRETFTAEEMGRDSHELARRVASQLIDQGAGEILKTWQKSERSR